jgi:hypothetical protein
MRMMGSKSSLKMNLKSQKEQKVVRQKEMEL